MEVQTHAGRKERAKQYRNFNGIENNVKAYQASFHMYSQLYFSLISVAQTFLCWNNN